MMTIPNAGTEEKLDHSYLLVRLQNSAAILENSLAVFYNMKSAIIIPPCNCTLGCLSQRNGNLCSHKHLHMNVHGSFIYKSP